MEDIVPSEIPDRIRHIDFMRGALVLEACAYEIEQAIQEVDQRRTDEEKAEAEAISCVAEEKRRYYNLMGLRVANANAAKDYEERRASLTRSRIKTDDIYQLVPRYANHLSVWDHTKTWAGLGALAGFGFAVYACVVPGNPISSALNLILGLPIMALVTCLAGTVLGGAVGLVVGCIVVACGRHSARTKALHRLRDEMASEASEHMSLSQWCDTESRETDTIAREWEKELDECRQMVGTLDAASHHLSEELGRVREELARFYDGGPLHPAYQNLPAVASIYQDFESGAADTFKEAYNKFDNINAVHHLEAVMHQGLGELAATLQGVGSTCYELQREVENMQDSLTDISNQLDDVRATANETLLQERLSGYYARLAAESSDAASDYARWAALNSGVAASNTMPPLL